MHVGESRSRPRPSSDSYQQSALRPRTAAASGLLAHRTHTSNDGEADVGGRHRSAPTRVASSQVDGTLRQASQFVPQERRPTARGPRPPRERTLLGLTAVEAELLTRLARGRALAGCPRASMSDRRPDAPPRSRCSCRSSSRRHPPMAVSILTKCARTPASTAPERQKSQRIRLGLGSTSARGQSRGSDRDQNWSHHSEGLRAGTPRLIGRE
jgi:hypothetical protein